MFSVERLRAGLNTKFLGREVKYLDQTPSTNDDAWNYFHNGSPNGTLIITDDQQHGRGRRKNKWFSTKEKSLTFSFILHPEMGHVIVRRHPKDDFQGICPNHGDCLEGLTSGLAIEKRTGMKGEELKDKSATTWIIISNYLAQAVVNYILVLSPQKVILGGGVMKHDHLFPIIRKDVKQLLKRSRPLVGERISVPVAKIIDNHLKTLKTCRKTNILEV